MRLGNAVRINPAEACCNRSSRAGTGCHRPPVCRIPPVDFVDGPQGGMVVSWRSFRRSADSSVSASIGAKKSDSSLPSGERRSGASPTGKIEKPQAAALAEVSGSARRRPG